MSTGRKGRPRGSRNKDKIPVASQHELIELATRTDAIIQDAHKLRDEYERISATVLQLTETLEAVNKLIRGEATQ